MKNILGCLVMLLFLTSCGGEECMVKPNTPIDEIYNSAFDREAWFNISSNEICVVNLTGNIAWSRHRKGDDFNVPMKGTIKKI